MPRPARRRKSGASTSTRPISRPPGQWSAAAGLTNITFVETSFADLAALPANGLPEFDFIVAHGVLSWISPANQRLLIEVIGQRLRAGRPRLSQLQRDDRLGSMLPLHTLMRLLAETRPERTDLAVPAIFDQLAQAKDGGAKYFPVNPAVEARLDVAAQAGWPLCRA